MPQCFEDVPANGLSSSWLTFYFLGHTISELPTGHDSDCVSAADAGRALSAPVCAENTILEEGPLVGIPTYRFVPPFDSFGNGNFTFRGDF